MNEVRLVAEIEGSPLALARLELEGGARPRSTTPSGDSLLYVAAGSGALALGVSSHPLEAGSAALVLAGEEATVQGEALAPAARPSAPARDRHAPLGERETVVHAAEARGATGGRSYEVLFGPENGSTRATLFVGHVPPGRAPWHFHLYDEIVWIPKGPARLHLAEGVEELGARRRRSGSARARCTSSRTRATACHGRRGRLHARRAARPRRTSPTRRDRAAGAPLRRGLPCLPLHGALVARRRPRPRARDPPALGPRGGGAAARSRTTSGSRRWRLVSPGRLIAGRGAGVPALLSTMRLTRPLGRALGLVPAPRSTACTRSSRSNRGRLGRLVPDGPAPRRR